MKINWKQKLSSRKFWAACVAYATGILAAWGVADSTVVQVTGIITGVGALAVYMLAESMVDVGRKDDIE